MVWAFIQKIGVFGLGPSLTRLAVAIEELHMTWNRNEKLSSNGNTVLLQMNRPHPPPLIPKQFNLGICFSGNTCELRLRPIRSSRTRTHKPSFNHSNLQNCPSKSHAIVSIRLHDNPIPSYNSISNFSLTTRASWNFRLLRWPNVSWKWTSQVISMYLLCLTFGAEAHDYPSASLTYACEDVNTYYAHTQHLKGNALKKKLHSIIAMHRRLSYREVWDALKILDAADYDKPESSSGIVEIYSLRVVSKSLAGKPEGWNREHLWPRSYGLTGGPSLTDIHNIRPADVNVNSSRGNKYFGECLKSTKCTKPANVEAAPDTETDRARWAPPMKVRGDIARALMYMAVCYGFHDPGGGPGLRLSDSPSIGKREMGLLSTLLKWNELDPPSPQEELRNERICKSYQHNRNPFIDHPEYANVLWKRESESRQEQQKQKQVCSSNIGD